MHSCYGGQLCMELSAILTNQRPWPENNYSVVQMWWGHTCNHNTLEAKGGGCKVEASLCNNIMRLYKLVGK